MTIEERFQKFHEDNPQVYEAFERFTFEAIRRGRRVFGAKMIWERMRWYLSIETSDPLFKLNNDFTAYYARLFMERHPQHAGIFRTRAISNA